MRTIGRWLMRLDLCHDYKSFANLVVGAIIGYSMCHLYSAASVSCQCECVAPQSRPISWDQIEDQIEKFMENETALDDIVPVSDEDLELLEQSHDPFNHTDLTDDDMLPPSMHSDHPIVAGVQTVASVLARRVRILCFVITTKANLKTRAEHVKNTWTRHCNKALFISDVADPDFPTIDLLPDIAEEMTKIHIWAKIKAAFIMIYERYRHDYDWFVRADDDAYWIIENLRYMLMAHSTNEPIWFGCQFKPFTPTGYMSGGVGYVLSREALRRFVTVAIPNRRICTGNDTWAEDAEIAKCLYNVGVVAVDSRDSEARHRFLPFAVENHIVRAPIDPTYWFWRYMWYPIEAGMNCCSDYAVGFHYNKPSVMYLMEYLIYHLRPYGVATLLVTADGKPVDAGSLSDDQIMTAVRQQALSDVGPEDRQVSSDNPTSVHDPVPVMT